MAFGNPSSKFISRAGCLLALLALVLVACQKKADSKAGAGNPTSAGTGQIVWHSSLDSLELNVEIGRLLMTGPDSAATIHFLDSIVLVANDKHGKRLAHFKSREGVTAPPYDLISFRDFLWECEDSSQIEGSDLFWHNTAQPGIEVEGELQVVTKTGLITGEYLLGDMLMRHYEIGKVFTAVHWDELAGGRDGFEHGD